MNRFLAFAVLCIAVAVVGVAVAWMLERPAAPAQTQTQTQSPAQVNSYTVQTDTASAQAVQTAFQNQIPAANPDHTQLRQTAVSGTYAIQVWVGDNYGGEALMKYDATKAAWVVVTVGGGAWNEADLVAFGVPTSTAEALLAQVPH